jgi:prophage regulatory protein
MPKAARKNQPLASAAWSEKGSIERYLPDTTAPEKGRLLCDRPAAGAATSYVIGLDDEPGAALLAASVRDVLIRIHNVCALTGLSVPTIYRVMAKGAFPRPVKITATARAWKLSEVASWIETRERDNAGASGDREGNRT